MPTEPEHETDVVVTGQKLQELNSSGNMPPPPPPFLVPQWFFNTDHDQGIGLQDLIIAPKILEGNSLRIKLPGYDFELVIPPDVLAQIPPRMVAALTTFLPWAARNSPKFAAVLQHLNNEQITQVTLTYGKTWDNHGNITPFVPGGGIANVVFHSPIANNASTDLTAGSIVTINLNQLRFERDNISTNPVFTEQAFLSLIVHELVHMFVPFPPPNADGSRPSNEDETRAYTLEINQELARHPIPTITSAQDYNGTAVVGSTTGDVILGGMSNDALSGMAGNDTLSGEGGSNLLYGGLGNDLLRSAGTFDSLNGGLNADDYEIAASSANATVYEEGGVDQVKVNGYLGDYTVTQMGYALVLRHADTGNTVTIATHYIEDGSGRVELFRFEDGAYAAGTLEYMANPPSDGTCYDASGQPYFCQSYVVPVIIDLDNDGIDFLDSRSANVKLDIDGDGKKERVSWIGGDDGFLVFDRDRNESVTDFGELTFVQDLRGARSDLEGLLAFDTNRSGALDAGDIAYTDFYIWRDTNANGRSDKGELTPLHDLPGFELDLEVRARRTLDVEMDRSQILGEAVAQTGGGDYAVYDVALHFQQAHSCGCGDGF